MNKQQLIELFAKRTNLPQTVAKTVVDTTFLCMAESLARGERIEIRGFGSFHCRNYEQYQGRNPKTGEPVIVKSKILPFFKVGKELKILVNNGFLNKTLKSNSKAKT